MPAWILEKEQEQRIQNGLTVIWDAVKPIMLLFPFLVYLIGLLFVFNLFTNGV
ncbi:MAG TPA: hypothetical protein G4N92_02640 [Anaerolineae bacterium]|nr:hypothetical protein [Anaerolineae bacterium]